MSETQRLKHIADAAATLAEHNSLNTSAEPETTPDGLGQWEGGTAALKGSRTWVSEKSHATRTADSKNAPGLDYPTKITHRQDADFAVIHMEENGDVLLYNVKTDAWDIKGDSADIPYYEDENGLTWDYNVKTGAWDVPVTMEGILQEYAEEVKQLENHEPEVA
jgi:hypothetical protein